MRISTFLCLVLLLLSKNSQALTMAEAVDDALQHNPQIAQFVAFSDAAESYTNKARSPFWPRLGVTYNYWQADRDPSLDSKELSDASARASFNLFNGGSDWFRLDAAKYRSDAAKWQQRSVSADVVLSVQRAYIEVLRAEQTLNTTKKSMELLRQQHREAELRLEQGLIARNDLLRVSVEMATAQQAVVVAESSLAVAQQDLERTLGRPLDDDEVLTGVSFSGTGVQTLEELQEQMLTTRSELHYLRSHLAAQTADRKAVHGDLLPEIDVIHSYNRFGNQSLPEPEDQDYISNSTTMLQASWTPFSGFDTRYELAGRKHEMQALKEEIKSTENQLKLQLKTALEAHRVSRINLETARTSVLQAEENYRVNENRYKAQVATTVDLLDAQEFLTRTRNEEVKAQYDLYTAEAVIERVLERQEFGTSLE